MLAAVNNVPTNRLYKSDVFFDEVMIKRGLRVLRLINMSERNDYICKVKGND